MRRFRHGKPGPIADGVDRVVHARGWPLQGYFVGLILLFVAAAGSAAGYVDVQSSRDAQSAAQRDAGFSARTAATQLGGFVGLMRATSASLAANPQVGKALTNPASCSLTFSGLAANDGSHLDIVRSDGSVACSSRPAKAGLKPYAVSRWLRQALRGAVFVAPVKDARSGRLVMIGAAPLAGGRGAVAAVADLAAIGPKLASDYAGGHPVEFLIARADGTVLARSIDPHRWIGDSLGRRLGPGGSFEQKDLDGTARYYASVPVSGTRWRFYAGVDKASTHAAGIRLERRQLLIVLAGLALSVLGAWLVYRRVVVPIRKLSGAVRATTAMAAPEPVPEGGPREVRGLAADVNALVGAVRRELSERERAEEHLIQSNKMEAVGQLAGGVAHDFNNLLMAIGGFGELARQRSDDPAVVADLDQVLQATERAGQLTRQLLAFSRRQVLHTRRLDPNEIVNEAELLLQRLIGEDIEIVVTLEPEIDAVDGDSGQLGQVLLNLAVNARDAMPNGGTLTIETANVELDEGMASALFDAEPGDYVRLSVTDTGVGIPDDAKGHLFEPFFTTKATGEGTGLGLSTAYGIVKQSGGYMTVYSELGQGAVFNVYLPRSVAHPLAVPLKPPLPSRGTEHILLVEDESAVRELLTQLLQQQGYTVTSTDDPQQALDLAADGGEYDLLLTDVVMPKLNGRQLVEAMAERSPSMKVIYMSGYTNTAIVQRGVFDDVPFLQKPFSIGDLAAKVRATLDAA